MYFFCGLIRRRTVAGNERDIQYQVEVGDCEFKWARQYGAVWRQSGCLGVRVPSPYPTLHSEQNHSGIVWWSRIQKLCGTFFTRPNITSAGQKMD
jgi:hypothetical protein